MIKLIAKCIVLCFLLTSNVKAFTAICLYGSSGISTVQNPTHYTKNYLTSAESLITTHVRANGTFSNFSTTIISGPHTKYSYIEETGEDQIHTFGWRLVPQTASYDAYWQNEAGIYWVLHGLPIVWIPVFPDECEINTYHLLYQYP